MDIEQIIKLASPTLLGYFQFLNNNIEIISVTIFIIFLFLQMTFIKYFFKKSILKGVFKILIYTTIIVGSISGGIYYINIDYIFEKEILKPYLVSLETKKIIPNNIYYKDGKYSVEFEFNGRKYIVNEITTILDIEDANKSYIEYKEISKDINGKFTKNKPYDVVLHTKSVEKIEIFKK